MFPPDRRAPGESPEAYHAFMHYRDMGDTRSLRRAYANHVEDCQHRAAAAQPSGGWTKWRKQWGWLERARTYDETLDAAGQHAVLAKTTARAIEHMEIADDILAVIRARLATLVPGELSPRELAAWFDLAVKIQRVETPSAAPAMPKGVSWRRAAPLAVVGD